MTVETSLEQLMEIMAEDPPRSEEFWVRFLASPIFLLNGDKDAKPADKERIAKEGDTFQVVNLVTPDGIPFIPMFTSLEMLQRAIQEEANYLAIGGREVLEMTRGENIGVNPGHEFGLLLRGEEVARILDYFSGREMNVEQDTQVLMGAPSVQPVEMKEAIVEIFKDDPRVKSAHFALMTMPSVNNAQSYLVGVVFNPDGENTAVFDKAGAVAKNHIPNGFNLDFLVIDESKPEGVGEYLLKEGEQLYKAA